MTWKIMLCLFIAITLSCDEGDGEEELEISIPVSVADVKFAGIKEFVSTSATVEAIANVSLASETEGRYRLAKNGKTGKAYAPGDAIRKGETVIYLDNAEYENNIRIEAKTLNLDISQREYEKQKSLYDKGGVTLRELKNAESAYIDAKYNHDNAKIQLDKLRVRAPFNGVITDLPYYTPNVKVAANQPMMDVMNYVRLYAEVKLPAKELGRVSVGQAIHASHYNFEGDTLSGSITRVSPAIDPTSRSFKAMVEIDNPNHILRPGMFVKIDVVVAEKDGAVVIPKEVILARRRGNTVYVVEKGAAFERVIETGLENNRSVEVIDGLEAGDRLVVQGYETLRDRSKVKVIK